MSWNDSSGPGTTLEAINQIFTSPNKTYINLIEKLKLSAQTIVQVARPVPRGDELEDRNVNLKIAQSTPKPIRVTRGRSISIQKITDSIEQFSIIDNSVNSADNNIKHDDDLSHKGYRII